MLPIKRLCVIFKIALWDITLCYFYTKICHGKFWYTRITPSVWKSVESNPSAGMCWVPHWTIGTLPYDHMKYLGQMHVLLLYVFFSQHVSHLGLPWQTHILKNIMFIISSSLYWTSMLFGNISGKRQDQNDWLLCPIIEDQQPGQYFQLTIHAPPS